MRGSTKTVSASQPRRHLCTSSASVAICPCKSASGQSIEDSIYTIETRDQDGTTRKQGNRPPEVETERHICALYCTMRRGSEMWMPGRTHQLCSSQPARLLSHLVTTSTPTREQGRGHTGGSCHVPAMLGQRERRYFPRSDPSILVTHGSKYRKSPSPPAFAVHVQ